MPSPRRHLRGRRQPWNDRHHAHLLTGHDWCFLADDGWGHLNELQDDQLAETVADMQACWTHERHKVVDPELGFHHPGEPWFAQYAGPEGNARLFGDCHRARSFMEYQHRTGGYRPESHEEFLKTYQPPPAAPPAADPFPARAENKL